jgi:hypothetical protein
MDKYINAIEESALANSDASFITADFRIVVNNILEQLLLDVRESLIIETRNRAGSLVIEAFEVARDRVR